MADDLHAKIHAFFHEVWDPACVGDDPQAQDEYQAYEGTLAAYIRKADLSGFTDVRSFVERTEEAIRGEAEPMRVDEISGKLVAFIQAETDQMLEACPTPPNLG